MLFSAGFSAYTVKCTIQCSLMFLTSHGHRENRAAGVSLKRLVTCSSSNMMQSGSCRSITPGLTVTANISSCFLNMHNKQCKHFQMF